MMEVVAPKNYIQSLLQISVTWYRTGNTASVLKHYCY